MMMMMMCMCMYIRDDQNVIDVQGNLAEVGHDDDDHVYVYT